MFMMTLLLVLFTVNQVRANSITAPNVWEGRQFYLSVLPYQANAARTACESGYHMASIWEIADPSALIYNPTLGRTGTDSGSGPPSQLSGFGYSFPARGWVRTGYSYSVSDIPGQANCGTWLSNNEFYWGTSANLPSNWTGGEVDIGLWNIEVSTCDTSMRVWCIEDYDFWWLYVPLVFK
jgi:hypothetical protein